MLKRTSVLTLGLLLGLWQPTGVSQTDAVQLLLDQGTFWQARGDLDRAADAWEKLLRVDPAHPQALYGLGQIAVTLERPAEARRYAKKLRAAGQTTQADLLEQSITLQAPAAAEALDEARRLAQAESYSGAIAAYRIVLGGAEPTGELAVEYYQTLAATPDGYAEALRGLQRVVRNEPDNLRAQLALAELMTYQDDTRREGIQRLARLANQPGVASAARNSWREALGWMGDSPAFEDRSLFQSYLERYPNDAAVARQLQAALAADPTPRAVPLDPISRGLAEGYQALDRGNLANAASRFQSVLQEEPDNLDAVGGLGLVRLRQQRFSDAINLLQRAAQGDDGERWRQPLATARYWLLVNQAEAAMTAQNWQQARDRLQQAIRLAPNNLDARIMLANLDARQGNLESAEKALRQLYSRNPRNTSVIESLAAVLTESGQTQEAIELVARLPESAAARPEMMGQLRTQQALTEAEQAAQRGDWQAQRAALELAMSESPNNPWVRLELAQLLVSMGSVAEARRLVDEPLLSQPNSPDSLYASALIATQTEDWRGALQRLDAIPSAQRTSDMERLQRQAWLGQQLQTANQRVQQGDLAGARALLQEAERYADSPDTYGQIADAYLRAGDANRALSLIQAVLTQTPNPSAGLLLQYGGILAQTGQTVPLYQTLQRLQQMPLQGRELADFQALRRGYLIGVTDTLRDQGNLAQAYEQLQPLLRDSASDPEVQAALARLYLAASDGPRALEIFQRLVQHDNQRVDWLLGAANAALQAQTLRYAETVIDRALTLAPRNPDVQATAAQLYRIQGRRTKAIEALEASLALRQQGLGQPGAGQAGNPFAQPQNGTQPWAPLPSQTLPPPGAASVPGANGLPPPPGARSSMPPALTPYGSLGSGQIPPPPSRAAGAPTVATSWSAPPAMAQPAPAAMPAAAPVNPWLHAATNGQTTTQPASAASPAIPPMPSGQPSALASPGAVAVAPGPYILPAPAPVNDSQSPYWAPPAPLAGTVRDPAAEQRQAALALREELQSLREERSGRIQGGAIFQRREGEAGLSAYDATTVPLEASLPVGEGRVALRVTPVSIYSGRAANDYNIDSRFGGGPAASLAQAEGEVGRPASQSDAGVGVALAYVGERVEADIGTTPLGMQQSNVIGGITLRSPEGEGANFGVTASRRPVTDSLLSFAGATDTRTGQQWGGVTATGGRLDLGYAGSGWGVYGHGGGYALRGHNVVNNTRLEAGAGVYSQISQGPDHELTVGLDLTGITYDKNLRYFTYGHGGYFSPQRFAALTVPVSWAERQGRLRYGVQGTVGMQYFKEDRAPYFPGSRSLQDQAIRAGAQAAEQGLTTNPSAYYDAQSKTGLAYGISAAMEYQISPQLFLGGHLAADNARDYREWVGGLHLRYMFEPITQPQPLPLRPLRSPYRP